MVGSVTKWLDRGRTGANNGILIARFFVLNWPLYLYPSDPLSWEANMFLFR